MRFLDGEDVRLTCALGLLVVICLVTTATEGFEGRVTTYPFNRDVPDSNLDPNALPDNRHLPSRSSSHEKSGFDRGHTLFCKRFTPAEGLGPELNAASCASCHSTPTTGGAGRADNVTIDWVYADERDPIGAPGVRFIVDATGEIRRVRANADASRRTAPLFGVGLLEAIPLSALRARDDAIDGDRDGISGRLPWREGCYGRFGWQSTACDLTSFVESALRNELGIQSRPARRREISEDNVSDLTTFVRLLAPPRSSSNDESGSKLFDRARCSSCHIPLTGMARLSGATVPVWAYTDLLLHEMGNGPRHREIDSRTEFRTPPLWTRAASGPPYWHDGSAATLEDAIMRHGGEAAVSRRLFSALDRVAQLALIQFVNTR